MLVETTFYSAVNDFVYGTWKDDETAVGELINHHQYLFGFGEWTINMIELQNRT